MPYLHGYPKVNDVNVSLDVYGDRQVLFHYASGVITGSIADFS